MVAVALAALRMLARRFRVEPLGPAPASGGALDDREWLNETGCEYVVYRPQYLTAAEWRN